MIDFEHVYKTYETHNDENGALEDINIHIDEGEFVFILGHSGAGKSTFLKLIQMEEKPTEGKVFINGQDLTRIKRRKVPYLRRQMGIVFQDFRLLPNKTAYENVAFALECIGKPRGVIRAQVPEVLRLVGLAEQMNSTPDQLSGGEQQRVNVARAMVNRPPLLICDEPTGNLDPAISLGIMKLLERINRTGTTVIVATHDREMVDSMPRRVIALEAGARPGEGRLRQLWRPLTSATRSARPSATSSATGPRRSVRSSPSSCRSLSSASSSWARRSLRLPSAPSRTR